MANVKDILDRMHSSAPEDRNLVEQAYYFAEKAHAGQLRASGDSYIDHLAATAQNLAMLGMGPRTLAAGLLHDVLEDTDVTSEELSKEFGQEITFLVEGVTKLGKLKYRGQKRHVESLRKFFVAMSQDIRVLIIKLTDRLHNMETLEHLPKEKQYRKALETLEIYAPLADRLGIGKLRGALEDLAFPYLYPDEHKQASRLLKEATKTRVSRLKKIQRTLQKELAKEGVTKFRTDNRVKHIYSFWRKLQRKDMDTEKIYDITALRVIVTSVPDCYRALGVIHRLWRPLPGRIKDYIASPKPNGYQSLHTTVFTGEGDIVEIQIRTEEMHRSAEFGIASHLSYKQHGGIYREQEASWFQSLLPKLPIPRPSDAISYGDTPSWVKELAKAQAEIEGDDAFLDTLRPDFFDRRIFVFTPKGDVIDLPIGATPIDFAYAIHSHIGDQLSGAKVNRKLTSIGTSLENGDIIEAITKPSAKPTDKWLSMAKTANARNHIRAALHRLGTSTARKR